MLQHKFLNHFSVPIPKWRTALFWAITQRVVKKFLTDVSARPIGVIFKGKESTTYPQNQHALYSELYCTAGDSFRWHTMVACVNYTPWRWTFKGRNILHLRTVFVKWLFKNIYVCVCHVYLMYSQHLSWGKYIRRLITCKRSMNGQTDRQTDTLRNLQATL